MAVLSSAILSSLFLNTKINVSSFSASHSHSHPLINVSRTPTNRSSSKYHTIVACKSGIELGEKEKKILLDRYGYDADEHLSPPSLKSRRRTRDTSKAGRRKHDTAKDTVQPQPPLPPLRPRTRTTHKLLQVLAGKARRKKLLSPKGMDVRPMMEVVKGAVFDILQAAGGCPGSLRAGSWLDLYSGTGSVGIEAISRGCSEVHFVEMDPWVVSDVLQPNLKSTGFLDVSVIHTLRVENFIERAEQLVGKVAPFGYVSVTPPYTEVDYGILMEQLSRSKLIGEDTFVVVEYPSRTEMLDSCACLPMITDRRFGRTYLAIYGPKWAQKKRKSESLR